MISTIVLLASLSGVPYLSTFESTERYYGIPHTMLVEVAREESGFRADVIECKKSSKEGALGIMQLLPKYHPKDIACNPEKAIMYAGGYLKYLYNRFGSWYYALVAYNWGETRLAEEPYIPKKVRQYTEEILDRTYNNGP